MEFQIQTLTAPCIASLLHLTTVACTNTKVEPWFQKWLHLALLYLRILDHVKLNGLTSVFVIVMFYILFNDRPQVLPNATRPPIVNYREILISSHYSMRFQIQNLAAPCVASMVHVTTIECVNTMVDPLFKKWLHLALLHLQILDHVKLNWLTSVFVIVIFCILFNDRPMQVPRIYTTSLTPWWRVLFIRSNFTRLFFYSLLEFARMRNGMNVRSM